MMKSKSKALNEVQKGGGEGDWALSKGTLNPTAMWPQHPVWVMVRGKK